MTDARAVLVLIDGARADVLRELLGRGDLPNLARWVIEPGGLGVGTTVFPSTTGVAYVPFLFGRFPGSVGIPGIRWLDRRGAAGGWRQQWRAARAWLEVADEPWRFLFVVFPGVDGISHLKDPLHPAVLESYRLVDRALGDFVARVRQRGDELPAFFVGSDHGMTVMRDHSDVAVQLERDGIRTLRHPTHVWCRGARAATMVSGNASVQVYFDPRSGRDRPLTESELPGDMLDRFLALPAVRLAACRSDTGGVIVRTRTGRARLTEASGLLRYEPQNGDPLGLGGYAEFDDRELLARTRETDVPDAPRQLLQLFHTARAGDLALAASPGADFRGPWEIPEHRAGHGSLIAEHMEVPIAASVALPELPMRTVDLMPTILERLDVDVPPGVTLDGVPFSKLAAVTDSLTR